MSFEPEFFFEEVDDEFKEEQCNFRHLTTTPERAKKRVLSAGTLLAVLVHHLRTLCRLPSYNVPTIRAKSPEDIESAAEACREHWSLGTDRPILSVGRVVENAGVVMSRLNAQTDKVDAFSRSGPVSIVVLNTAKGSPSRSIFDTAHEIGHLVLHAGERPGPTDREKEADHFAGAFLMPRKEFRREFGAMSRLDWEKLFELKRRWRASLQAIIYRAYALHALQATEYRHAYKYIYARGWHRGEPHEPAEEHPELIPKAVDLVEKRRGLPFAALAGALHWRPDVLSRITDIPIPSSPQGGAVVHLEPHRRP